MLCQPYPTNSYDCPTPASLSLTSCPECHGPELVALLHLALDEGHEEGGVAAPPHVGHHAQDEALLLVVLRRLVLVPRLLHVLARPRLEAVLDGVGVVAGAPAGDADEVAQGERDGHLGEPARAVPVRPQLVELGHQLLVGPADVEGDLAGERRPLLLR